LGTFGFVFLFSLAAFADSRIVVADKLNIRSGPSTNDAVVGSLSKGATVEIAEYTNDTWVKINTSGGISGYVARQYLGIGNNAQNQTAYVNADSLNIRSGPSTSGAVVGALSNGETVEITEKTSADWFKIKAGGGRAGYVAAQYLVIGREAQGSRSGARRDSSSGSDVVEYAKQFLGKPYSYGGNGPNSFDCSGFAKYVYAHFGVNLPRTTYSQVEAGTYVERSNLQPGDLVFFKRSSSINHVGIYAGGGQIIHSPQTGDVVKFSPLNSGYYNDCYYTARRVR
jgi:cell wall-associated NlpC family hydrolase